MILIFAGVHVGDLNDDEMDDLYCHTTGGQTSVTISTVKGKMDLVIFVFGFSRSFS